MFVADLFTTRLLIDTLGKKLHCSIARCSVGMVVLVALSLRGIISSMVVNWRIYNESLVRSSEIVLDFDVIDNWE
jgi:hypothetical protein